MRLAATGLTAMALVLAAPALAQDAGDTAEAGDARVVELTADGPVITDQKAASPEELTEQVEADILEPMKPVLHEGDTAVLEPLIAEGDDMSTEAAPKLPASADDLNAKALEAMQIAMPETGADIETEAPTADAPEQMIEAASAVEDITEDAAEIPQLVEAEEVEAEEAAEDVEATIETVSEEATETAQEEIEDIVEDMAEPETEMVEAQITVEEDIEETITNDGNTVLRERIMMTDADETETISETMEVIDAAQDAHNEADEAVAEIETAPEMIAEAEEAFTETSAEGVMTETSVKITVISIGETTEEVEIEASGPNVTTTVSPDGTTRLIRIDPAEGQSSGATLITITRN